MRFGQILRLSSSASGGGQRLSHVISVLVTRFLTSSSSTLSAGSGSGAGYCCSRCVQQDKDSWKVKVFVWWDFGTCKLPVDANVFKVSQAITAAIKSSGIIGPIRITAFGDWNKVSEIDGTALDDTGIHSRYWTPEGVNASYGLMRWVSECPPPAHIFLVSNDRDFASALHSLRRKNYNILLASETYSHELVSAATIIWDWCSLVKGKTVAGIRNKQPPYGPYNYWCGHMVPLQDPFAAGEKSNSVKTEDSSASNSNLKTEESPALSESKSPVFFRRILKWFKFWGKVTTPAKLAVEK